MVAKVPKKPTVKEMLVALSGCEAEVKARNEATDVTMMLGVVKQPYLKGFWGDGGWL
jgi:hypothetical protein